MTRYRFRVGRRSLGQIRLILLQSCIQAARIFSGDGASSENDRLFFLDLRQRALDVQLSFAMEWERAELACGGETVDDIADARA